MLFEHSVSVRGLVEFVYQSGDLDLRFQGKSKLNEGIKVHQKIQKSQGGDYTPEVSLKRSHTFCTDQDQIVLKVSGRADGVLKLPDGYVIDEIKGTGVSLEKIDETTFPVHWAQAKIYGAIFCEEKNLTEITIQLTYADFENKAVKRFKQQHTKESLELFWENTLMRYQKWLLFKIDWKKLRNGGAEALAFPFKTYRQGQRALAVSVFNAIKEESVLLAQAPTGIGKTLSTLFPAIKTMGTGDTDKIFYLAAKSIAKGVAEESLNKMRLSDQALRIKSLTLTAKDKICLNDQVTCFPEKCPFAKGHYDRNLDALWDLIRSEDAFTRDVVERYSKKHFVCPYEFSLDVALHSDVIICDYNYVFDPRVYLRRFFDVVTESYVFLMDEAHNMIDRGRHMYSAALSKSDVTELKKMLTPRDKSLASVLEGLNRSFLEVRKVCDEEGIWVSEAPSEDFYEAVKRRLPKYEKWLIENAESPAHEKALALYFDLLSFQRISELYDQNFMTYIKDGNTPKTIYKLFCVQPASPMARFIGHAKAAVFFSATLSPMAYYKDMLVAGCHPKLLDLPTPFDPQNRLLGYVTDLSVIYKDREASLFTVCQYIYEMAHAKTGNYMVFFPSYRYMEDCYALFESLHGADFDLMLQTRSFNESEREAFLEAFEEAQKRMKSMVSFVVMGGHFSEGIDLHGSRLIGVMVIGVGLPMIGFENDLMKRYFEKRYGHGFQFAYQFPGINKVMQCAGRVIRSESDRGVVLLLDQRYESRYYKRNFPKDWGNLLLNQKSFGSLLDTFWEKDIKKPPL